MDKVPVSSLTRENSGAWNLSALFNYKKLIYTLSSTPVSDLHQEHTCESLSFAGLISGHNTRCFYVKHLSSYVKRI